LEVVVILESVSSPPQQLIDLVPSPEEASEDDTPEQPEEPPESVSLIDPPSIREPKPLLERSLLELEFPTRTMNWADRMGISTIGQLVAWDPAVFSVERAVGRLTVTKTRAALEEALGCTWEEARGAHADSSPPQIKVVEADEDAVTVGGSKGWNGFANGLEDRVLNTPCAHVELRSEERRVGTAGRAAGSATAEHAL